VSRSAAAAARYAGVEEADIGFESLDVPDLDDGVIIGTPLALVYKGEDGEEYEHEFTRGRVLVVDGGVLIICPGLSLTDLGIEEED